MSLLQRTKPVCDVIYGTSDHGITICIILIFSIRLIFSDNAHWLGVSVSSPRLGRGQSGLVVSVAARRPGQRICSRQRSGVLDRLRLL